MITLETVASTVSLCVVVLVWTVIFYKMVPSYRVNVYRQRLFELRGELFDFAATGNIDFRDPAYIAMRRRINALIQHAHEITLFKFYATLAPYKLTGRPVPGIGRAEDIDHLLNDKSSVLRNKMDTFQTRVDIATTKHLVRGSILLMTIVGIVAIANSITTFLSDLGPAKSRAQLLWCAACNQVLKWLSIAPRKIETFAECFPQ